MAQRLSSAPQSVLSHAEFRDRFQPSLSSGSRVCVGNIPLVRYSTLAIKWDDPLGCHSFIFAEFDKRKTVRRPELAQNMVYVILNRLLRKVQAQGDLLVRQALSQKFQHLLLPPAEPDFRTP